MSQSQTPLEKCGVTSCRCGESRPDALTNAGRGPCYECCPTRIGEKRTEEHHPFGRYNLNVQKITIDIPANWHRVLDARRAQRPAVLKRPGDDPLHEAAAFAVTVGEAAHAFADFARREQWPEWSAALADLFAHGAYFLADWLLILAGKLDDRLGQTWANDLGMPTWHL